MWKKLDDDKWVAYHGEQEVFVVYKGFTDSWWVDVPDEAAAVIGKGIVAYYDSLEGAQRYAQLLFAWFDYVILKKLNSMLKTQNEENENKIHSKD